MVLPTCGTPLSFRPLHTRLVWCWPACVCSVYGQDAVLVVVWLLLGRVSCRMIGLIAVGSVVLPPASARLFW